MVLLKSLITSIKTAYLICYSHRMRTEHKGEASINMNPFHLSSLLALLLLPVPLAGGFDRTIKAIDAGQRVRQLLLDRPVHGPESLAFDRRGEGPYTGVSDGRVLKWRGGRLGWTEFARNSRYKTSCNVAPESECGRPLGLQFHKKSGDLYVADAYLGLMKVGAGGGPMTVVATEAGGVPFNFPNGVDVDQGTGDVYFTDSSTTYRRSDYLMIVLSGDATGRLMKLDRQTNRVTVLRSGLAFPNGVAVSPDRTHLVVTHTGSCQLRRYWIRGPRAGESELFAELPGYPDNVRPDPRGGYWVALNRDRMDMNVTIPLAAIRVGGDGRVAEALDGLSLATVSEVVERNGTMWLGSVDVPYVGLFRI